jgi:hypothetical protein
MILKSHSDLWLITNILLCHPLWGFSKKGQFWTFTSHMHATREAYRSETGDTYVLLDYLHYSKPQLQIKRSPHTRKNIINLISCECIVKEIHDTHSSLRAQHSKKKKTQIHLSCDAMVLKILNGDTYIFTNSTYVGPQVTLLVANSSKLHN